MKSKKIVLFTLSDLSDNVRLLFTDVIMKAVNISLEKAYWIFRLHPHHFDTQNSWLIEQLEHIHPSNYEIQKPRVTNLYQVLKETDIHITFESSVTIEALSYGIKTIVTTMDGYDYYKYYIDKGYVYFSQDSEEIVALIEKSIRNKEPFDAAPIIASDVIERTINTLINKQV